MSTETITTTTIEQVRHFASDHGWGSDRAVSLKGDVSRRQYYRLYSGSETAIACHYPDDLWPIAERFIITTELLAATGIRVPAVCAVDSVRQMMLLEDLGETSWYSPEIEYRPQDHSKFTDAITIAHKTRRVDLPLESSLLPPLDDSVLAQELEATLRYLPIIDVTCSRSVIRTLKTVSDRIIDTIGAMPLEPAHRDFMVRNLIPYSDQAIGVLDHQDLRLAPFGYDFASLMNDSLFPPQQEVDAWRRELFPELSRTAYHTLAAQRTLKAVGSYARAMTEGNHSHQRLISPTLNRFVGHLQALPESGDLAADLLSGWLADLAP